MNQQIIEQSAIAVESPHQLTLLTKNPCSQTKLVASWQRDEYSKLYCMWIPQTTNINE